MKLTIINGNKDDDTVILDDYLMNFDLAGLINDSIWAVQWNSESGEIEYKDDTEEKIDSISQFQPIIDKFHELKSIQDLERQKREDKKNQYLASKEYAFLFIDEKAEFARQRLGSFGANVQAEYTLALSQAKAFKENGFTGEIPSAVNDNMMYQNMTSKDAALNIIEQGEKLQGALETIRTIRLSAKKLIIDAVDGDNYLLLVDKYLKQLEEFGI